MTSTENSTPTPETSGERLKALLAGAWRVADKVAKPAAAAVDREARFPHESLAALRAEKLLAAGIPVELGGLGCSVSELGAICTILGRACASTGMIYAMHQMQVLCIVRHAGANTFLRDYLREAAERQWLFASGTSEVGTGGDLRSSITAVEAAGTEFKLHKSCTTLSYGEHADGILITARRDATAPAGDQVLALIRKEDYTLTKTGEWDVLGMRGTCSPPFEVNASASLQQILPEPFRDIATRTMIPFSHVIWSAVWLGIAADAVATTQALIKKTARKAPKVIPAGATGLVEVLTDFQQMKANVRAAAQEYDRLSADATALSSAPYILRINNLKLASSQQVKKICLDCLAVCGLGGYANNSPFSLGRQVRDALSAQLMVSNNRLRGVNASLLLVAGGDVLDEF